MAYPNPTFQTAQIVSTAAPGDSSTNGANTAFVNAALDSLMGRNVIVDGNFDSFTSGTSAALPTGVSTYSVATMYRATAGTGGAGTSAYGNFAIGTAPAGMESHANNYLTINQTTASTGTVAAGTAPALYQNVENVSTYQGQSSTFSCWLWTNSGTATISNIYAGQYFGPGTGASATVALTVPVTWNVTTTPQRFSVRIDWPTVAGKTLGTGANALFANTALQIGLWFPSGSTFSINTREWQLERALSTAPATGNPSAFEYRGVQAELARITRYYQVLNALQLSGYAPSASPVTTSCITFPAMRTIPVLSQSGQTYSNATSLTISSGSPTTAQTFVTASAAGTFWAVFVATLDARI
jgi:hypothetical protein